MALIRPTGSGVAFGNFMRALGVRAPERLGKIRQRGRQTKALVGRVQRPPR